VNFGSVDRPLEIFLIASALQWAGAFAGVRLTRRWPGLATIERSDLDLARNAVLTLLAVIIGFSLSMAVSRYDLRKTYEEAEANAIGTEYSRVDLLPPAAVATTRELIRKYASLRVAFFSAQSDDELARLQVETTHLQDQMWEAASRAATDQPTPLVALAVSGMNEVIDSEGRSRGAWGNRLPIAVWGLLVIIAVGASLLFGVGRTRIPAVISTALPLAIAVGFFLIAEIDSPRGGVVRVLPENLVLTMDSIGANPK
jgi:hypothetical protein